jgi:hypothetical protein
MRRTGVLRGGPGRCGSVLGDVREAATLILRKKGMSYFHSGRLTLGRVIFYTRLARESIRSGEVATVEERALDPPYLLIHPNPLGMRTTRSLTSANDRAPSPDFNGAFAGAITQADRFVSRKNRGAELRQHQPRAPAPPPFQGGTRADCDSL